MPIKISKKSCINCLHCGNHMNCTLLGNVVFAGNCCSNFRYKIKQRTKYNSVKTRVDGILFDSKLEARRYGELKLLQRSGHIRYFLMQVPFRLEEKITYRCDFMVVHNDGTVEYEDTKGAETKEFKLKLKLLLKRYPITLKIMKLKNKRWEVRNEKNN